jgi:hypothetical protein
MQNQTARTQIDISMKIIVGGLVITAILLFVFFQMGVVHNLGWALAGLLNCFNNRISYLQLLLQMQLQLLEQIL